MVSQRAHNDLVVIKRLPLRTCITHKDTQPSQTFSGGYIFCSYMPQSGVSLYRLDFTHMHSQIDITVAPLWLPSISLFVPCDGYGSSGLEIGSNFIRAGPFEANLAGVWNFLFIQ